MAYTHELIDEMLAIGFMTEPEAAAARAEIDAPAPASTDVVVNVQTGEIVEPPAPAPTEEVALTEREINDAVEVDKARHEVYGEQESAVTIVDPPAVVGVTKAARAAVARKSSGPKTTTSKVAIDPISDAELIKAAQSVFGDEIEMLETRVSVSIPTLVSRIRAVKIREKVADLLDAVATGKSPSVFTQIGLRQLAETGSMSSSDLFKRMVAGTDGKVYSDGTARAQSQQVHSILKTFGVIGSDSKMVSGNSVWPKLERFIDATEKEAA